MSNRIETLGMYMRKILDTNRDGQIDFKDFLGLFPSNAIAIAVIFIDLIVLVAEYRVWDFGMTITGGDHYKALGFVLISALPFYLGQVFWLYPRAVSVQKIIAIGFIAGGLYASYVFGLADLSQQYNVPEIGKMLQKATVAYIVFALVYVWQDPGIKAQRAKAVARAALELERERQAITRTMLKEWQETKSMERETIDMFGGDEEAVIAQLEALRGKGGKSNKGSTPALPAPQQPANVPNSQNTTQRPWFSEDAFLLEMNLTRQSAEKKWGNVSYQDFAKEVSQKLDISGKNMRQIYDGMFARNGHKANP